MRRLTAEERRLLKYPPTKTTWVCRAKVSPVGEQLSMSGREKCGSIIAGTAPKCWYCGNPKPARPTLLWPKYLAACKKAGVPAE